MIKNWKPLDLVVVAITITICGTVGLIVLKPLVTGVELSDDKAKLMATVIASLISIISMYVGAKLQANKDRQNDND